MKKRSAFNVMAGLIGMIKPMLGTMAIAIIMGCIGNLMASFITILGGYALAEVLGLYSGIAFTALFAVIVLFAVLRGVLRYAEQACNHYIAFKLLASIRHKVFAALRRLAPAKLDGGEKGNLISIITSDIELLEVFYAHTISPVAIAVITSVIMCLFVGNMHWSLGIMLGVFYVIVGIVIPVENSRRGQDKGQKYRKAYGELNTKTLDNLYGLDEIIQYQQEERQMEQTMEYTNKMEKLKEELKRGEGKQKICTDSVILIAGIVTVIVSGSLYSAGTIEFTQALIAVITVMSSFGPTAALSALSNNLNQTLASGNRVLDLLAEEPVVYDILEGAENCEGEISLRQVNFSYKKEASSAEVLKDFTAKFRTGAIHGILGESGCGKSTLLKLLMRFYETDKGGIAYGKNQVNQISTDALRKHISYVTQETFLFQDTIENNIRIADEHASKEQVIQAARKASIHDFIMTLPNQYETMLSELGEGISGGEKQRIGIARAFLHQSNAIFLDEPTSNIDSLNEGIILKSLDKEKKNKTIILVSHRKSTMGIADTVTQM